MRPGYNILGHHIYTPIVNCSYHLYSWRIISELLIYISGSLLFIIIISQDTLLLIVYLRILSINIDSLTLHSWSSSSHSPREICSEWDHQVHAGSGIWTRKNVYGIRTGFSSEVVQLTLFWWRPMGASGWSQPSLLNDWTVYKQNTDINTSKMDSNLVSGWG